MKLILTIVVLASTSQAALKLGWYRYYDQLAPEVIWAGHPVVYELNGPLLGMDVTCSAALNACTSGDYTPNGTELLLPDAVATPPSGVQQTPLVQSRPFYRATNIGSGGNPPGYWNLFQCACPNLHYGSAGCGNYVTVNGQTCGGYNGNTPHLVTVGDTSSPFRFHLYTTTSQMYLKGTTSGWPAGTQFTYYGLVSSVPLSYMKSPLNSPPTKWADSNTRQPVKVLIPANTPAGSIHAGWTLCQDVGLTNCQDFAYDITINAAPTSELNRPTVIPAMPSWYDQTTTCLIMPSDNPQTTPPNNCSMTEIATAGSAQVHEAGANWYCIFSNPDLGMELNSTGTPRFPDFGAGSSNFSSNGSISGVPVQGYYGYFYDTARTYYSLARWWNHPEMENCARAMASEVSKKGPGISGFAANFTSRLNFPSMGLGQTLGNYQCGPSDSTGCWGVLHNLAYVWTPDGTARGMSRYNGGNYISTWVPNSWQPEMKSEVHNLYWATAGWNVSTNTYTSGGGYYPDDGRSDGRYLEMVWDLLKSGEPSMVTTGASGSRVTALTPQGQMYRNMIDAMLSAAIAWGQPDGTALTTNVNAGRVGTQAYMIVMTLDGLIEYWERTHDPVVPPVIQSVLQVIGPQYSTVDHGMPGNSTPTGPWCMWQFGIPSGDEWYAYGPGNVNAGPTCVGQTLYRGMSGQYPLPFLWYWAHWGNGDNTYQVLGDEMLRASTAYEFGGDGIGLRDSMKNFNENMRYWTKCLAYRMGYR